MISEKLLKMARELLAEEGYTVIKNEKVKKVKPVKKDDFLALVKNGKLLNIGFADHTGSDKDWIWSDGRGLTWFNNSNFRTFRCPRGDWIWPDGGGMVDRPFVPKNLFECENFCEEVFE